MLTVNPRLKKNYLGPNKYMGKLNTAYVQATGVQTLMQAHPLDIDQPMHINLTQLLRSCPLTQHHLAM